MKFTKLLLLILLIFIALIGDTKDTIISGNYSKVIIYNKNSEVLTITDEKHIEKIKQQINKSKRENANEMSFKNEPAGMIKFESKDSKTVKVPFFLEGGDVLTSSYYINTNFNFKNN